MNRKIKRFTSLLLCAVVIATFTGCQNDQDSKTSIQLTLLIESGITKNSTQTSDASFHKALQKIITDFSIQHHSVEFQIETLPCDTEEREPVLQRMRTEIMAGKGPDIFLLPTATISGDLNSSIAFLEPLFQDVEQSMHGGKFLDISPYYDADTKLDKAGLNQAVMDGGCVGDARYVLPLRYTVPVVMVHTPSLEKRGIGISALSSTMESFFSTLVAHGNGSISPQFQNTFFCAFPEIYDYEKEKVVLDTERMTDFLTAYRDYVALSASCEVFPPADLMTISVNEETPILLDNLGQTVMDLAVLSKLNGEKTQVLPLNTSDGTLAASVTYWGAIGASCEHPQEAYDFLSQFLSPEFQKRLNALGLSEYPGWPIRTNGFVPTLWDYYKEFHQADLAGEILDVELVEEDFPVLQAEIGSVRFETAWDKDLDMLLRNRLYDWDAMKPTTEKADAIAQDILDELRWRIQE